MTGNELKEWRERIGMSQSELAKALDVARNTITRWETEQRSIPPYLALALRQIESEQNSIHDTNAVGDQ